MSATLIDGKATAATVDKEVQIEAEGLIAKTGVQPHLSVILVGDDPASQTYVGSKKRACIRLGLSSEVITLPASAPQEEVAAEIDRLNADDRVHGILLQLPVPEGLDEDALIQRISPDKDVDGLHPLNAGRLMLDLDGPVPCTPAGCMRLLREYGVETRGKTAVVVGRSNIVGKPMALLLGRKGEGADATATIAHSRTPDLPAVCRSADILVAAVGRPEMVRGDWIKPGAAVLDIGINRVPDETRERGYRLVGDVCFDEAKEVAGLLTPVPGGVGPMTIALLLRNTLDAYKRQLGLR